MKLIQVCQCLCDRTRLRILNLLLQGPLCVCHLQAVLGEPQVKISKHLRYLKARGLVEVAKSANWRIYRLPARRSHELEVNLRCLQDCAGEDTGLRAESARLEKMRGRMSAAAPFCFPAKAKTRAPTACAC